jgi:Ca2+/Na+ antiporter
MIDKVKIWLEIISVVALFLILVGQIRSNKALSPKTDFDDYAAYGQVIKDQWGPDLLNILGGRKISPGYPMFLALVNFFAGQNVDIKTSAFWGQFGLLLCFVACLWIIIRRWLGVSVGLVFLCIMAGPNFYVHWSSVLVSNFFFSVIWLPTVAFLLYFLTKNYKKTDYFLIIPLFSVFCFVFFVRTGATSVIFPLLFSVFVAFCLIGFVKRNFKWEISSKFGIEFIVRFVVACLLVAGSYISIGLTIDFVPQTFYKRHLSHRIVTLLPPATDTPAEKRIEETKRRINEYEGECLQHHLVQIRSEFDEKDVQKVWLKRLIHHPFLYFIKVLNEIRWKHYIVATDFIPFNSYTGFTNIKYMLVDDSARSKLYRMTGIKIKYQRTKYDSLIEVLKAIFIFIFVWGTLLLGMEFFLRRYFVCTFSVAFCVFLNVFMFAATVTLDGRYLLVWAMPIYTSQAVGIMRIITFLGKRAIKPLDRLKEKFLILMVST